MKYYIEPLTYLVADTLRGIGIILQLFSDLLFTDKFTQ